MIIYIYIHYYYYHYYYYTYYIYICIISDVFCLHRLIFSKSTKMGGEPTQEIQSFRHLIKINKSYVVTLAAIVINPTWTFRL